jgi:hypothetical protein
MSQESRPSEISKKRVVLELPGADAVTVRRDVAFDALDTDPLVMDLYYPANSDGQRSPAVVIVAGYRDAGFERMLGCRFKDMGSSTSWARAIAASGMVGIAYTNREPSDDLHMLLQHLRDHAEALSIDENRFGLWSSSGNAPLALSMLMPERRENVRCAAFCYSYMLDLDGATPVADAAAKFGFVNACAGRTAADVGKEVPLFIARAGQDQTPGVNASLDAFVRSALTHNLPFTLVNHPTGPHAFDLFDESEMSRDIVRRLLAFLRFHLQAPATG